MKFFSCILDDFQDYIYEGFASLLNKSRSANVGVVFCHQAIGDLDKVSEAFRNQVMTNTNIKVAMRLNDPDTCEHLAKTFGTQTTVKVTEKTKDGDQTGDGSAREVEQYKYHPNLFKRLGTGMAVVGIPHRFGLKDMKLKLAMRPDLPVVPLPEIKKVPKPRAFPPPRDERQEKPETKPNLTPEENAAGPREPKRTRT